MDKGHGVSCTTTECRKENWHCVFLAKPNTSFYHSSFHILHFYLLQFHTCWISCNFHVYFNVPFILFAILYIMFTLVFEVCQNSDHILILKLIAVAVKAACFLPSCVYACVLSVNKDLDCIHQLAAKQTLESQTSYCVLQLHMV